MEYRIVFKSRHRELHDEVRKFIDELLQSYGIHPKFEQKEFKNSIELRVESPVSGRRSLDNLTDEDGNVDLNKIYD